MVATTNSDGGELLGDGIDLLGDGGDLFGDGGDLGGKICGKKFDGRTYLPTYQHLTWVGARVACATKKFPALRTFGQNSHT